MVSFPQTGKTPDLLQPLRRRAVLAWLAGLSSVVLLVVQHLLWVIHPWSLVFIVLLVVTFAAAAGALLRGLVRLMRGPRRLRVLAWMLAGTVPAAFWVFLGWHTHHRWQKRQIGRDWPLVLTARAAQCLMEAQAVYLYPARLESQRLVMFYDDRVTDPAGDLQAMDRHIAAMEEQLGLRLREKIYWARGSLLWQRNLCCLGIALGSDRSPADVLDRHELAHAVLAQHENPAIDPPTFLGEGWAEAQAWNSQNLAERALELREFVRQWAGAPEAEKEEFLKTLVDPEGIDRLFRKVRGGEKLLYLQELTNDYWYHHDKGPVYNLGGAFVDFLLRHKGPEAFLDLYFSCRPGKFAEECQRVLGISLQEVEKRFWTEMEKTATPARGK